MATQTELAARLEAIEAAIDLGALEIEHEGKKIKYRSLAHMRSIASELRSKLTGARSNGQTLVAVTRG